MTTGKWAQAGVPYKGWACEDIEDAGAPDFICEMCDVAHIRFIHLMTHPDYRDALRCGCICAGRMEETPPQPTRVVRFQVHLSAAGAGLGRKWRRSRAGNPYLNTGGFNVVVYRMGAVTAPGSSTAGPTGSASLSASTRLRNAPSSRRSIA